MTEVEIVEAVARRHGVTVADMVGHGRQAKYLRSRYDAIKAVREAYPHISSLRLGRLFDRDHTTILYALRQVANGCDTSPLPPKVRKPRAYPRKFDHDAAVSALSRMTIQQVAAQFGVSQQAVQQLAKKRGVVRLDGRKTRYEGSRRSCRPKALVYQRPQGDLGKC